MVFSQFNSSMPFSAPMPGLLPGTALMFAPIQMGLKLQYKLWNILSWGMLDDMAEEIEHALVEGRDVTQHLIAQIQTLQGANLTPEQRQFLAQSKLYEAEENLQAIVKELITNLMQLPYTRLSGKSSRKRFAVTLEGEAQRLD